MTNSKTLFRELVGQLQPSFDPGEAEAIVYRLLESANGFSKNDVLSGRPTDAQRDQFQDSIDRILRHEPVQYVLNEEEFFGRNFYVDSSVLIPRPETEELVRYGMTYLHAQKEDARILDIGTGSGCVAITLALENPGANVFATDISEPALQVAKRNAATWKAKVDFTQHNILSEELPFTDFDLVVSNPPYIAMAEEKNMHKNVLDYEPHLALFVPDSDPLIFYKAIAAKVKTKLKPGGQVMVEINERLGEETKKVFLDEGYQRIQVLKDINSKDRIVIASV